MPLTAEYNYEQSVNLLCIFSYFFNHGTMKLKAKMEVCVNYYRNVLIMVYKVYFYIGMAVDKETVDNRI